MENEQQLDKRTSSVKVTLNAKGGYQWEIKYYFDGSTETEDAVAEKMQTLDAELKAKFEGQ